MTLVHCHGTFDLLHPGHIDHLQQAKALGDRLVVTITADRYVNKGPGRPVFDQETRRAQLLALRCVDAVHVWDGPTAAECIQAYRPDIYCKGKDYEGSQDPEFQNDLKACREVGAQVRYVGTVTHSSTQLLNRHANHIDSKVREFAASLHLSPAEFRDAVESLSALKVLVIGEQIIDRYTFVNVQGLTSKNRVLSGAVIATEDHTGGALAVVNHIAQFTWMTSFQTAGGSVVKQRWCEPRSTGKELVKLFATNTLPDRLPASEISRLDEYDVVVVADFGHGVMTSQWREAVQQEAKFLALNCQTNSANHGFNIIDRQYQRADCFSLDETELTLSVGVREYDRPSALHVLRNTLGAKQAWLTRGGTETLGADVCTTRACPPIATSVVDTVGAGDAFFAVAALGCAAGLPIGLTTFLGQLAGAQAVQIVGNKSPIDKQTLLKSGLALLNQ